MLYKVTRRSGSLGRMGVTVHSSPTETTKRHSEKTSFLLCMVIMAFLRIPSYGLVFLKSTSTDVGKDIQSVGGGFFFPHGDINGMSTMSLITLLLLKKKKQKTPPIPYEKMLYPNQGLFWMERSPAQTPQAGIIKKGWWCKETHLRREALSCLPFSKKVWAARGAGSSTQASRGIKSLGLKGKSKLDLGTGKSAQEKQVSLLI